MLSRTRKWVSEGVAPVRGARLPRQKARCVGLLELNYVCNIC
jgi:hypothetical protein